MADVEALRPELAFLGACALDPFEGIAAFDPEDAEIKRALLRNSGRIAAAVLNEKLETGASFTVGRAESLESVVLEADAPDPVARAFAERGIKICARRLLRQVWGRLRPDESSSRGAKGRRETPVFTGYGDAAIQELQGALR